MISFLVRNVIKYIIFSNYHSSNGGKKTRPHETLTNANFEVFAKYFLTKSVYCQNKNLELVQNLLFMDLEKK